MCRHMSNKAPTCIYECINGATTVARNFCTKRVYKRIAATAQLLPTQPYQSPQTHRCIGGQDAGTQYSGWISNTRLIPNAYTKSCM
eukprot:jgi/Chrzof1/5768/Cz16g15050.t1